jgi:hypothetical protein
MKKYFLIFSFVLVVTACKKEETKYIKLSSEMKEWAWFKPGSYWVYQNEATGELDSVYVIKDTLDHDFNYSDETLRSKTEKVEIQMMNSKKNKIIIEASFQCKIIEKSLLNELIMGYEFLKMNSKNEIVFDSSMIYYDKYAIHEILFNNVYQYKTRTIYYGSDYQINFNYYFISKNYWIIKKIETRNNVTNTWNLIRYQIVQ